MSAQLSLKEIERKAFRSTYQDGLWDIYYGLIVMCMSIFVYRPPKGYSPMNIILSTLMISLSYGLFWAGKKYITLPRMGQVRFGSMRKQKARTLAIVLGVFVLIQVGLVGLTTLGWLNPDAGAKLNTYLNERNSGLLVVAVIGALMVGPSIIVIAYFSDFPRGYYIAIMMALAVFVMIYLNQPLYAIMIGGLIILPGLVLFVRFLKTYPLQPKDGSYE
ncbi:MAG TPA: hypothetical protein PKH77_04015 [Anaerolineae bacterium]|nr:hypothetical protein [Anaerolineae bacterium]